MSFFHYREVCTEVRVEYFVEAQPAERGYHLAGDYLPRREAKRLSELFLAMIRGEELSSEDYEDLDEAAQLKDISHMPARVKCAELAWRTLDGML